MRILSVVSMVAALALAAGAVTAQRRDGPMPGSGAGPGRGMMRGQGQGGMHSMVRHQHVMRDGLPAAYRTLVNPLTASADVLATGRRVFAQTCAACHGETGDGDGPAAANLDPQPSNLRVLPPMPMFSSDAYLYWTVADGGLPVGSAMPAFRDTLSPDEIWSVILYLRTEL